MYEYSVVSLGMNVTWLTYADLDANGAVDIFIVAEQQG